MRLFAAMSAVVLFLAAPAGALAQGTTGSVSGTVTGSGDPLPGATVTIKGTRFSTSTDADGYYRLLAVPPGAYTLSFSLPGFKTVEIPVQVTAAGSITVNANLEVESPMESITVTVSLDAGETERLNVAASTGVIIQSFNGVPGPRIVINDANELGQEAIRESYQRAMTGIRWNVSDNGRTTIWVGAGVFVGSQDLTIERRSGDRITYSGTQLGGYAEAALERKERLKFAMRFLPSSGTVVRAPGDAFTGSTVTNAKHTLTVKRFEASTTYGFESGPFIFQAGPELFYFKFNRSGTVQANSTTVPGASAIVETDTTLDRTAVRMTFAATYRASPRTTLTTTAKVGSRNWAVSLSGRLSF